MVLYFFPEKRQPFVTAPSVFQKRRFCRATPDLVHHTRGQRAKGGLWCEFLHSFAAGQDVFYSPDPKGGKTLSTLTLVNTASVCVSVVSFVVFLMATRKEGKNNKKELFPQSLIWTCIFSLSLERGEDKNVEGVFFLFSTSFF